ncbi:DUF3309 family protein [Aquibium sp. ELW1220]|uniref:DUF3309 family protein n=1 Tax=Aquibium sp. ELW1220 TaxID=2976766 RepID=UPI0025B1D987|nr:DUF3309 family protein [Aquibium sp. ELW1220]MDN2580083.1 DUF3309 family protein [Aquibium sp. ELW1220]
MGLFVLLILIVLFAATVPVYPYSRGWGYSPVSVILLLAAFWLILIYFGLVAIWWPTVGVPAPAA